MDVHRRPLGIETLRAQIASNERQLGLKVFSATKAREREFLGEAITDWIRTHPEYAIFDKIVTQSSDAEFHCLSITLIFTYRATAT